MKVCAESLSLLAPEVCTCGRKPNSAVIHQIRNLLQSLSNCAYLVARDPGVSPENAPLLTQMQTDVALAATLFRKIEPEREVTTNVIRFTNSRRRL